MRVGIAYVVQSSRPPRRDRVLGSRQRGSAPGWCRPSTYYVVEEQGHEASVLGLILSAYGLGAFLGAIVTSRLPMRRAGRLMLGGNLARGLALVVLVATGSVGAMIAAALVAGFVDSVVLITYITFRAAASTDEVIGRVGGTARTISLGLQPIGFIAAGLLIDAFGGGVTLATIGLALVATSGLFVLSGPLRNASAASR